MYCDKDSRERCAIMDMSKDQMETIRRALTMYRLRLYQKIQEEKMPQIKKDLQQQFDQADVIAQHIDFL